MVAPNHWTANKTTEFREGFPVGPFDRALGLVGQSQYPDCHCLTVEQRLHKFVAREGAQGFNAFPRANEPNG